MSAQSVSSRIEPEPSDEFPQRYQLDDIWEVIGKYSTPRDLEALSLVNHELSKAIRRLVFKQLIFEVDHEDYDGVDPEDLQLVHEERASRAVERFLGLSANDDIARLVRSWHCDGTYSGNSILQKYHEDTIPIFFDTFQKYKALKKLVLVGVQVDNSSLCKIASFKNLETLEFDGVDFKDSFTTSEPLLLKALRIGDEEDQNSGHDHGPFNFCQPERLEFVILNGRFSMNLPSRILNMLLTGNCTNLVQLEITLSDESTTLRLFNLLESCPLLQSLTINQDPLNFNRAWFAKQKDLARHACRHLSEFAGPAIAVVKIIQGRPLRRLFIRGPGVDGSYCLLGDAINALTAVDAENVTELHFERTRTTDARKLLRLIGDLPFLNLCILGMPIDDQSEDADFSDQEIINMIARVKGKDDAEEDEGEDLEHRLTQYESCYDREAPNSLMAYYIRETDGRPRRDIHIHYGEGYTRLLADIASGVIELPKNIVKLQINQSRIFKRVPFTKYHELAIMIAFADLANERLVNLVSVSFGIENVYHKAWQKNMVGQWGKPKVYARVEGRSDPILTGTLVMFPKTRNTSAETQTSSGYMRYNFGIVPKIGAHMLNETDLAMVYEDIEPSWWETQGCLAQ